MARKANAPAGKPKPDTPKHAGGRPSEMTEQVVNTMLDAIALGMHYEDVADLCGKTRVTIWAWMKRAQEAVDAGTADECEIEFLNAVRKAQAEGVQTRLRRIVEGENGWQGSAWIQERRFRQKWGQTIKQEVTGANGDEIKARIIVEYADRPIETDE